MHRLAHMHWGEETKNKATRQQTIIKYGTATGLSEHSPTKAEQPQAYTEIDSLKLLLQIQDNLGQKPSSVHITPRGGK